MSAALYQDLRLAAARLRRAPAFMLALTLILGLGLALSVIQFGLLRGILGALPYADSGRLHALHAANPRQGEQAWGMTGAEIEQLAAPAPDSPLDSVGRYSWGGLTVIEEGRPREFGVGVVGQGYFQTFATAPLLGRWFNDDEHRSAPGAIVLSHGEWQRQFGGDPAAIGQRIDTDRGPAIVVGVMPAEFAHPAPEIGAWVPDRPLDSTQPGYRFARYHYGVARLKPGVSPDALATWLKLRATEVQRDQGLPAEGWEIAAPTLLDDLVGEVRDSLWAAMGIALLVLVVACANAAILLDARNLDRRHADAILSAIGASQARIRRLRLIELYAVVVAAGLTAMLAALAALHQLRHSAESQLPRVEQLSLGMDVMLFALVLMLVIPPLLVWRQRSSALSDPLRSGASGVLRGLSRTRQMLPGLSLALSTISLIGAMALLLSLHKLGRVDPGFDSERVQVLQLFRPGTPEQQQAFADAVQSKLSALPGVRQVALTSAAPLSTIGSAAEEVSAADLPELPPVRATVRRVGPGYLGTLGIPLLGGRSIDAGDRAGGEDVIVISQTLAQRLYGDASALDRQVKLAVGREGTLSYRVVGVMDDIRNDGLRRAPAPEVLIAYAQRPWVGQSFVVSSQAPVPAAQLEAALWSVDPAQSVTRLFALADDVRAQSQSTRFFATAVSALAVAALLLSAFGVYAIAALSQRRRLREFGLRLAVGAQRQNLAWQVLSDGALALALGAAAGMFGSVLALRALAAHTFQLNELPLALIIGGAAIMGTVAVLAQLAPALRAMRTDPIVALRAD